MARVTRATLHMDADASGMKRGLDVANKAVADLEKQLEKQIDASEDYSKTQTQLGRAYSQQANRQKALNRATKRATASTKKFTKSARDAKQSVDGYGSSLSKAVTGLKGLAAAAGVGIAVRGMFRAIQEAAELGTELTRSAQATNTSVEGFQALDKIVRDVGGTTEQMTQAMATLNQRAGDAARGADNAFRQFGVTLEAGPVEQLKEIAGILEALPAEQRLSVSSQFFGEEGGRIMVAALSGGMENVATRIEDALASVGISSEEARQLAQVNATIKQFTDDWRNSVGRLVADHGPRLVAIFERLSAVILEVANRLLGLPPGTVSEAAGLGLVGTGVVSTGIAAAPWAANQIANRLGVKTLTDLVKSTPLTADDLDKVLSGRANLDELLDERMGLRGKDNPARVAAQRKLTSGANKVSRYRAFATRGGTIGRMLKVGGGAGIALTLAPIAYEAFLKELEQKQEDDLTRLIDRIKEFNLTYSSVAPGPQRDAAVRDAYRDYLAPAAGRAGESPLEYLLDPNRRRRLPGSEGPGPRPPGRGGLPPPPWPPPKGLFSELRDYILSRLPEQFEGPQLAQGGQLALPELPPYPDFRMSDPGKMERVAQAARDQAMAEGGLARDLELLTDAQLESMVERAANITETYEAAQALQLRLTGETHRDWDVVRTFQNASEQASLLFDTMVSLESDIAEASNEGRGRAALVLREELESVREIYDEVVGEVDLQGAEQAASSLIQTYLKLGDLARSLIDKRELFDAIYQSALLLGGVGFQVDPVTSEGKSAIEQAMEKRDQVIQAREEARLAAEEHLGNRAAQADSAFRGLADALFEATNEAVTLGETMRQFFFNLLREIGSDAAGNLGSDLVAALLGGGAAAAGGSSGDSAGRPPGLAMGGYHAGGMALVGERGPELVDFATPGRVYPNHQLGQALRGGGPVNVTVNLTVNGSADTRGFRAQVPMFTEAVKEAVAEAVTRPSNLSLSMGGN